MGVVFRRRTFITSPYRHIPSTPTHPTHIPPPHNIGEVSQLILLLRRNLHEAALENLLTPQSATSLSRTDICTSALFLRPPPHLPLVDHLLHRASCHEAVHDHVPPLPDPVRTVHTLVVHTKNTHTHTHTHVRK